VGADTRHHLARWLADVAPTTVVTYHALADEVPLDDLPAVTGDRHRWALTRLGDGPELTLHRHGSAVERHRHGFHQPVADGPVVPVDEVGIVLVPGLAFGPDGARLGRGGGHYDRLLARLPGAVRRIGVTPMALVADGVPREAHDVPMHALATERGVLTLQS
jgi:5-formyltetrahydrofolate cyclo-ligase